MRQEEHTTKPAERHEAWNQEEHAELFGGWNQYSTSRLLSLCSQFNECQLFKTVVGDQRCRSVSDVGCAVGAFYRFFHGVRPSLRYKGFDVSEVAIGQAKKLYPAAEFSVFDDSPKSAQDIESDIVFSRDVVHHQADPVEFLQELYDVTRTYLVLRVRTREVGPTVFDVDLSCQYTYGRWVPFIVFNTSELIDLVRSFKPAPASVVLRRHPMILGGGFGRFVPKELYYQETGTAETALLIEKGSQGVTSTAVTAETWPEARGGDRRAQWLRRIARRLGI